MGCHTWFYKKINISIDEARENVIRHRQDTVDSLKKSIENIKNPNHITDYGITKKDAIHVVKVFERQIRMIKKGLCNCAVFNKFDRGHIIEHIKGVGLYEEIDDFHDVFRVGGYPDDKLFSLDDTIEYINNKNCYFDTDMSDTVNTLKEFWDKYPDGMILFG